MDQDQFTCIVFCPVCCSTIDVEGDGEKQFDCTNCETHFSVVLDREIIAGFSMH